MFEEALLAGCTRVPSLRRQLAVGLLGRLKRLPRVQEGALLQRVTLAHLEVWARNFVLVRVRGGEEGAGHVDIEVRLGIFALLGLQAPGGVVSVTVSAGRFRELR